MGILKDLGRFPIAFGGASISGEGGGYGFGDISESDAIDLLNYSYEQGIRVFDSAPIYGFGESEKRIGKAFKNFREKVYLISKSGVDWHQNGRVNMTNDPKITQKMLEQSLKRFQSDYIDLYMIHWPSEQIDIRKPLEVLAKAKMQGKIKHIGLCNSNVEDYKKASEVDKIEVLQAEHSFFENKSYLEFEEIIKNDDLSFMGWGTLEKGILTKRVDENRTFDKSDCRSWAPWWKKGPKDKKIEAMKKLWPFFERERIDPLSFALGASLCFEGVEMALCGARSISQLDGILVALNNPIKKEIFDRAKELSGAL